MSARVSFQENTGLLTTRRPRAEMSASIHILPIAGVFGSSTSAVGYGAWVCYRQMVIPPSVVGS